ncbi:MAG: hypothetical protein QNJ64_06445 [Crocosphaera sp.]|nr:hypothetical protein [Crocosphaera sp.]
MGLGKVLILLGMGIVIVKFVASLFGQGNLPWLNKLVTVILFLFIGFEVYQIAQLLVAQP